MKKNRPVNIQVYFTNEPMIMNHIQFSIGNLQLLCLWTVNHQLLTTKLSTSERMANELLNQ